MAKQKQLTEKMQEFALAYVLNGGNVTEASKVTGLNRANCSNWVNKHELVIAEIDRLRGLIPVTSVKTAMELQEQLNKMLDDDYKDEVINPKTGLIEYVTPPLRDRVKLFELLGKFGGHFVTKHEISQPTVFNIGFSDEEIEAEFEELEDGQALIFVDEFGNKKH